MMQCTRKVTDGIYWVGANDRRLAKFENMFPIPRGVSYNSYVILDGKTALMDTADSSVAERFMENVAAVLDGRALDYLVVQHMEPDHCANIAAIIEKYPDVTVVGNAKTMQMIGQFYSGTKAKHTLLVKEGDKLPLGEHELTFVTAPMVHWPEVMVSYESKEKILFSADAFGTFGALNGALFDDEIFFDAIWMEDARRYYTNIVGKYGPQVQALLKKAAALDIRVICPLHGPVLSENLSYYLNLYNTWSSYAVETDGIVVAYTSVYGNTKRAVERLISGLRTNGCPNIAVYDLARCDMSAAVADASRYGKLVLASATYNADVFPFMKSFIEHLTERNYQKRTIGVIENGSWAPTAARVMTGMFEKSKNITWLEHSVKIMSSLSEENEKELDAMAEELCK